MFYVTSPSYALIEDRLQTVLCKPRVVGYRLSDNYGLHLNALPWLMKSLYKHKMCHSYFQNAEV